MANPAVQFNPALSESIAGVGDPWVAAMNTADLNRQLASMPRGAGGAIDYNAAALKLLGRHPLAAAQLQRMAAQQQHAGHQGASLDLQRRELDLKRDALNKPQYRQDEETGDWVAFRPDGTSVYVTGPQSGNAPTVRPAPPPAAPATSGGLSPEVLPDIETLDGSPTPTTSGATTPKTSGPPSSRVPLASDVAKLGQAPTPENIAKFDGYYGPGAAQRALGTGQRSDLAPEPSQAPPPPGGVMRVAGEVPPDIAATMAQAIDPESTPDLPPNVRPQQSLGGKGRKAVEQASQIDANKKQNTLMEKQVEAALFVKDYVPSINRAVRMWDELKTRGSSIPSDLPLIHSGPGTAVLRGVRGIANKVGAGGMMPDIVANQEFAQPFREAMGHLELLRAQALKGQGSITEGERAILRKSLPSLDTSNPAETEQQLRELANVLTSIYRRGALASRALQQREQPR